MEQAPASAATATGRVPHGGGVRPLGAENGGHKVFHFSRLDVVVAATTATAALAIASSIVPSASAAAAASFFPPTGIFDNESGAIISK